MMKGKGIMIREKALPARGFVSPSFVDLSTGKRVRFGKRHNTLSYMSAEAMAAAFGGDPSYIPAFVGFIYGNDSTLFDESTITRMQSWDSIMEELSSVTGSIVDVQVVSFSYPPSLGGEKPAPEPSGSSSDSGSDESSDYCNILPGGSNAITFHAVSNSTDDGAMFGTDSFKSGDFIYQAILLGRKNGKYYVLSRVSLMDGGEYLRKPDGFEVALDWTVVFH